MRKRTPLDTFEQLVQLMGRHFVSYHPKLLELTGSVTSALLLSQGLSWMRYAHSAHKTDWFWKTSDSWAYETGLSRHEQDSARKKLKAANLLKEKRMGMPARLSYQINLDEILNKLSHENDWDWGSQAIKSMLGVPIAIHRPLFEICQSAKAAILLARLLKYEREYLRIKQTFNWRRFSISEVRKSIGLTRHELDNARKKLRELGLIHERLVGVPPRVEWMIDFGKLYEALSLIAKNSQKEYDNVLSYERKNAIEFYRIDSLRESHKQDYGKIKNLFAEKPKTRLPETGKLNFRKAANKIAENRQDSLPETGNPIEVVNKESINKRNTPPTPSVNTQEIKKMEVEVSVKINFWNLLIWPSSLSEVEKHHCQRLFKNLNQEKAQLILDELVGNSRRRQIDSKLAYLRVLVSKYEKGEFVPTYGISEAEKRSLTTSLAAKTSPLPPKTDSESALGHIANLKNILRGKKALLGDS